jgi:hypothetical protein
MQGYKPPPAWDDGNVDEIKRTMGKGFRRYPRFFGRSIGQTS